MSIRQASTTVSGGPDDNSLEVTPASCCCAYFCSVILFSIPVAIVILFSYLLRVHSSCYIELFAHTVSVSNSTNAANVSTADWRTGLVAKSPVTGCKLSLHTVTSRLLRGDEVISQVSPSLDGAGRTDEPVTIVDFRNVLTPGVNGSVVWDYRVESVVGLKAGYAYGLMLVICRDIPVKFTADEAGNVVGWLLGGMRRCDYLLQNKFYASYPLY